MVEALSYKLEGFLVRFPIRSFRFFIDLILPTAIWT